MKNERVFLKKLIQREIGEDEFYEKEMKLKRNKTLPNKLKRNKSEWD